MQNLNKKLFIIALLFALITSYFTYRYLHQIKNKYNKTEYIKVIVATKDILPREKITSEMIEEVKVIKGTNVIKGIQDRSKIIGKYAKGKILKGEVIPADRLFKDEEKFLSFRISNGKRAISIAADNISGVSDLIKPGDYVDVYVTVDEKMIENKYNKVVYPPITKLLLQNIKVLAIDKKQFADNKERKQIPNRYAVTLEVSPIQAEKLVLGEEIGRLKLALRPLNEDKIYNTPGTIRQDIVPDKGKITVPK
ncbi:Flp pilus assembly protein CpaB [Thermohalobacter berrensis]|uniref:Flp pilus assembly protein CpaB n=1 Tax=Thermohalobacter berrensis TaxID=99594 RepID=A0A419SU16_9FIRM|nr:Flp pilus assembly protein CpaB [Thermohalobacter berrensis]RKD28777.1 Flp pilus assembly protein CpaB [Thermohalobacter berrensis]